MARNVKSHQEVVVYVPNSERFADSKGTVHLARTLENYVSDDVIWYRVQLLTDSDGLYYAVPPVATLSSNNVLNNRHVMDITPKKFYQFSSGYQYPLTASGFVETTNIEKPLSATTRNGLGSGLYGIFVVGEFQRYKSSPDQVVYQIWCDQAYPLQDGAHGDSITNASLQTNRYLERIMEIIRADNDSSYDGVYGLIQSNSISGLVMLWNLALFRTQNTISEQMLVEVLTEYVVQYFSAGTIFDSITSEELKEQPINSIMRALGYDGIIASDHENNGWDRGCVCYNYEEAHIIQGSTAPYSTGDVKVRMI